MGKNFRGIKKTISNKNSAQLNGVINRNAHLERENMILKNRIKQLEELYEGEI